MSCQRIDSPRRLSIDDLTAAGFYEGHPSSGDRHDREFWYAERTETGILWQCQVRFWEFSRFSRADRVVEDGFDFVLHLTQKGTDFERYPRLEMSVRQESPQFIIDYCRAAYSALNCTPVKIYDE